MTRPPLSYLPTMFATCMLFQLVYVLCILIWFFAPGLPGHATLAQLFPQFSLLDLPNFIYGLVLSMMYGWLVAATFVFFYNLWPRFAAVVRRSQT